MPFFQTDNLSVISPAEGVATLVIDVAGKSVNLLCRQVLVDLDAALDQVAGESAFRLLLIRSGKESGFVAGADLREFSLVQSAEEATALSEQGQRLFDKLADLRMPTVAMISGPCLGGGLEFALACDYRVVIEERRTQLGLPETELGLVPGWGGTQRLPRVVGLERALRMILGNQRLSARQALDWGLADALQEKGSEEPPEFLTSPVKRPRKRLPLRTWRQKLIESTALGRWMIFRGTQRLLRRRLPDDFPAPAEALHAVWTGLKYGPAAGLKYEREANGRLALTPASRNLIHLFLQQEQARRRPQPAADREPIRRIGVVGAGTMGAGIAQQAAFKGCEVVIREVNDLGLAAGVLRIAALFQKALERGLLTPQEYRRRLDAIRGTTSWKGFADVDLVIEAVIEDLDVKQAVFRDLDQQASPSALLATNTSSLSVRQIQEAAKNPGRVAGLHFFNPVHKMPLVEVVRGPATSDQTVAALATWVIELGKTPVIVKDSPGFVVNRVLMPYLNEALLLVQEGMPVERIDQSMRRFGMPVGPLELLDQIGLDVAAHVARAMEPVFGGRIAVNPGFRRMKEKSWLGQKSGAGFYLYRGRKKKVHTAAVAVLREGTPLEGKSWLDGLSYGDQMAVARQRMVGLMVNEAAACLGEELADNAATIDLALILGAGWAPHRGGPLRYGEDQGFAQVALALDDLARRFGPRFEAGTELRRLASAASERRNQE